jgi:ribosomal protein L29
LRLKSFEDLHTLWFVLLKEKNMLLSERERCRVNRVRLARPDRLVKVRQTMTRILTVLSERKAVQLRLQQYQKEHLLSSPDGPASAAAPAAVDAPSSPTSTNV